ncbi:M14 family zinc carboxypeptidase [Porifericola rhodea]|uniref:M14 family zinc carboxypeptidase n=1 Tax=Porifericola rhodea TaxID=930972 RepID=UPI002666E318|nr:M14 family zinc carboxypeptidase [Porifericola rhodea]WKN32740.1 M14 family zinc carboxypeptidase [Porifericola rhodea]
MQYTLSGLLILLFCQLSLAQQPVYQQVYDAYNDYREESIQTRRFKHSDIEPILLKLDEEKGFEVNKLGESIEGRAIYDVTFGSGKTQVLLWSQMHGDESTATMAGLDLFNFFMADDAFNELRNTILNNITVHFIPMLNPDGAEVFERRNALGVDMNRDALRLQSPESRILKNIRDSLQADFGFNLHDQSVYYTTGIKPEAATISFLPPAYNYAKDINPVRERAMQVIVELNEALQHYIKGHVGRYNDDFEPRAFGDNIQKWGTSTILIESGGFPDDPEKQRIRKLNFMILVKALHSIATKNYKNYNREDYWNIPENERYLYDLLVRNVKKEINGKLYTVDVGINHYEAEYNEHSRYFKVGSIRELGDMSTYYGYDMFDARGMTAVPGKVYEEIQPDLHAVQKLDAMELISQGYTTVRVKDMEGQEDIRRHLVLDVVSEDASPTYTLEIGSRPNFILEEAGTPKYAVVNGFLREL